MDEQMMPQSTKPPLTNPVEQPVPVNPPKIKSKLFLVATLAILLLLGGIGGFVVSGFVSKSALTSQVPPISPTRTLTPTPSPDPMAGWKTYTNTTYNYTLQYPPEYTIAHGCSNCTDVNTIPSYIEFDPLTQDGYGKITVNGGNDKLATQTEEEYFNKVSGISTGNVNPLTKQTSTIGMFAAFTITTEDQNTHNQQEFVYLLQGNKGFSLEFAPANLSTSKNLTVNDYKNISTFDQILSTFRFLPSAADGQRKAEIQSVIRPALETYKFDYKNYPDSLTNLVPKYLFIMPKDPITHVLYDYVRNADKLDYTLSTKLEDGTIYSVNSPK